MNIVFLIIIITVTSLIFLFRFVFNSVYPAKIRALWPWRMMTADVLPALLPKRHFFLNEY